MFYASYPQKFMPYNMFGFFQTSGISINFACMNKFRVCILLLILQLSVHAQSMIAEDPVCLNWDSGRSYISYEFGLSKINKIYIAEGDTVCDVLICDGTGKIISTTCPKSPILKWAFDKMLLEIKSAQTLVDNGCKPYHYQLTLHNDTCQIIAASSSLKMIYNDGVKDRINDLKAYMIDLWRSNFIK